MIVTLTHPIRSADLAVWVRQRVGVTPERRFGAVVLARGPWIGVALRPSGSDVAVIPMPPGFLACLACCATLGLLYLVHAYQRHVWATEVSNQLQKELGKRGKRR